MGGGSSQEKGLGQGPHQLFPIMKCKSPSSLDIRKLCSLQTKAQKGGPDLVSRMNQVFSEENNSFSQVEIQWKVYWVGLPTPENPEEMSMMPKTTKLLIPRALLLRGFLYLKHLSC